MARILSTFSIWSETLSPEQVTAALLLEPDRMVARGSDRSPPRTVPKGAGWHVSGAAVNGLLIVHALQGLLSRVSVFEDRLVELRTREAGLNVRFQLILIPFSKDYSFQIEPSVIQKMAQMGGSLNIDWSRGEVD